MDDLKFDEFTLKLPQVILDALETKSDFDLRILAGIPDKDQEPDIEILRKRGVWITPVDSERPPTDEETKLKNTRQAGKEYLKVRKRYMELHEKLLGVYGDLLERGMPKGPWESFLEDRKISFPLIPRNLGVPDFLRWRDSLISSSWDLHCP